MKPTRPQQQTLQTIITADARRIPNFIDAKKEEHHQAFLKLQSVYEWISDLAKPQFLSEHCIEIMYLEMYAELRQIKNTLLYRKVEEYIVQKMFSYWQTAVDMECFEAAANFKRYLRPVVE